MTGVPVIAADGAAGTLGDTTLLAPTTFAVLAGLLTERAAEEGTAFLVATHEAALVEVRDGRVEVG